MIFTARVKQSTEFDMTIYAVDEAEARAVVEEMDGVLFVGDAVLPVTVVDRDHDPSLAGYELLSLKPAVEDFDITTNLSIL
jgi:hypothetical protein